MKKESILFLTLFVFAIIFFNSCKKGNDSINRNAFSKSFTVGTSQIIAIAEHFKIPLRDKTLSPFSNNYKSAVKKSLKEIKVIFTSTGDTAAYIINYEENGFIIIAGDKRLHPILAFSSTNNFPTDFTQCPPASLVWLLSVKEKVEKLKKSDAQLDPTIESSWQNVTTQQQQPIDPPPNSCTDEYIQYGPLLSTAWGQTSGYNSQLPLGPTFGCMNLPYELNGHAYAGCVAVAMAQVIRYFQYPSNYAWSVMPSTYLITSDMSEVARLIKDIDNATHSVYNCNSTTCSEDTIAHSLINDFLYSSATYNTYNLNIIESNLQLNRPVIIGGGSGSERHAWVCDGYMYSKVCVFINGVYEGTEEFQHLSMNWGYNGAANGWYYFDNFEPTINGVTHNLNNDKTMIYNIVP
jgi:hypothetical protein